MDLKKKKLFQEAEAIFRAGVASVNPEELVKRVLAFSGGNLTVDGDRYSLDHFRRIYLLGAGITILSGGTDGIDGEIPSAWE